MFRRGMVLAACALLGACNGFGGFPTAALQTAGGAGRRVPGDGDLAAPRFAETGGGTYLALHGRDEFGILSIFRLNTVSLERALLSRANAVTDPAGGPPFEPIPDRGAEGGRVSTNGLWGLFVSDATNLLPDGTTEGRTHAYLRDVAAGATTLVDRGFDGLEGNGDVTVAAMSADGRFVAFASDATNLVPAADTGTSQIFLWDRLTGRTELVSFVVRDGVLFPGGGDSGEPAIAGNGRFVAFASAANDLLDGDTNPGVDLFVRDRTRRTTEQVNLATGGTPLPDPGEVSLSADGLFAAFTARPAAAGPLQVYLRDRVADTTTLVSRDVVSGDGDSVSPMLSPDGRFLVFASDATNLVAGDANGVRDVFLYDRIADTLRRVTINADGIESDGESGDPTISPDGRVIAFVSRALNLVEPTAGEPTPPDTVRDLYFFGNPLAD